MRTPPDSAIPHHGVEDREQLPHARHQRNLLGLAGCEQPLVELLDDGIEPGGGERPHVKRGSHRSPPSPYLPLASALTGVAVEGGDPHQGAHSLVGESAEFGQLREECPGKDSSDSGDAPEEPLVLLEGSGVLDGLIEVFVGREISFLSHSMCARMRFWRAFGAVPRRLFSETSISMSWRLLARTYCKAWASSSGMTLACGSMAAAKRARTKASILSGASLARRPMALAKSLAWRGLTMATGTPVAAMEVAARRSYRPVASMTTSFGFDPPIRERTSSTPA